MPRRHKEERHYCQEPPENLVEYPEARIPPKILCSFQSHHFLTVYQDGQLLPADILINRCNPNRVTTLYKQGSIF